MNKDNLISSIDDSSSNIELELTNRKKKNRISDSNKFLCELLENQHYKYEFTSKIIEGVTKIIKDDKSNNISVYGAMKLFLSEYKK